MTTFMGRILLLAASAAALLLTACGGGGDDSDTVESALRPTRMVVFGDGYADLGQTGTRFTINGVGTSIWTEQLASRYGLSLANAPGGTSYATAHARSAAEPDNAIGAPGTPTVKEQIDAFFAAGRSFTSSDLVIVNAGIGDIVAEFRQVRLGTQSSATALANIRQSARDLGAQVRRLVNAGARHVVIVGPYNLGRSPWATQTAQTTALADASAKFNEDFLVSVVDLGNFVFYVDLAFFNNLVISNPGAFGMSNAADLACGPGAIDAGEGIGTGLGQVSSGLCNTTTLAGSTSYTFADRIYVTPLAHQKFGDYAFDRIRSRW